MTEAVAAGPAGDRDRPLREWGAYLDLGRRLIVEKPPPNLVRSRHLQAHFPEARFLFLLRHPVASAMASQKFLPDATLAELLLHWHSPMR